MLAFSTVAAILLTSRFLHTQANGAQIEAVLHLRDHARFAKGDYGGGGDEVKDRESRSDFRYEYEDDAVDFHDVLIDSKQNKYILSKYVVLWRKLFDGGVRGV